MPDALAPTLLFHLPGDGAITVEFTATAEDSDTPRHGTWLHLTAARSSRLPARIIRAGHPLLIDQSRNVYFAVPGGQVFAIAET